MLIAAEKPAEIAVGEASVKRSRGERLFFAGGIAAMSMRVRKGDEEVRGACLTAYRVQPNYGEARSEAR